MRLPNLLATKNGRLTAFFLLYITEGIPLGFAATAVATGPLAAGNAGETGLVAVPFIPEFIASSTSWTSG